MAAMAARKYLDPAHSIIMTFAGPEGALIGAIEAVAEIVGRDPSNVYRWMVETDKGGTGGFIPTAARRRLAAYAKCGHSPKGLKSFFRGAEAA